MKTWIRANYQPNKPLINGQPKVTASKDHLMISKNAAKEGMVLLKNEKNILPLPAGKKIAVFGKALFDYVKGGGGSGDVTVSHVYNLYDGFCKCKTKPVLYEPLACYYRDYVSKSYENGALPGLVAEPEIPRELMEGAAAFSDTAMIVISRFSGEGWDRMKTRYTGQEESERRQSELSENLFGDTDYYLSGEESDMAEAVCERFENVIVVLNVGAVMDTSWFINKNKIKGALLAWQGGMEGGLATAELLMGEGNPSGKLPDTFADYLESYPSTEGFHASPEYVDYKEDIYVGYRYFETIPGAGEHVNYPFGYGLSYTTFEKQVLWADHKDDQVYVCVSIKNTGNYRGKEVVSLYVKAPQGLLGKAKRSLVAFEKTKELSPDESQIITLTAPVDSFASYDDLGKIQKSAYVLEAGMYHFYVGGSVRDAELIDYSMRLMKPRIVKQLSEKCPPVELKKRLKADGSYESLEQRIPNNYMDNILEWSDEDVEGVMPLIRGRDRIIPSMFDPDIIKLCDVADKKADLEEFLSQLSDMELIDLLGGQPNTGVANTYGFGNNEKYGIPNLMTTDGPAGVRILPQCEIYTTAMPCATLLASTWNKELLYRLGRMAAKEVVENNLYIWLAPAVNIHRSPLCGRNFEYYSEDPLLAGKLAASLINGVQSMNVGATVKHFCCNNKETNRKECDSRVSERAMREIYLKVFEIVVKESDPWVVMSSYNLINSVRGSENYDLLTGVLREEWGYEGVVCSDWFTHGEHYKELLAGNDIKMGCGYPERVKEAMDLGAVTREDLLISVRRLMNLILKAN